MNFIIWPFKWLRALSYGTVSGALIFAAATQWAGAWSPVELVSHFRVFVLLACLLGCALFLLSLSLARAALGMCVAAWLAWPMAAYYFPPEIRQPAEATATHPPSTSAPATPPEIKLALFNVLYRNTSPNLMDRILEWDADVVMLLETNTSFYRANYQRVRDRYPNHNIAPQDDAFGLWCFTRLPVAKDLSKTRGKALGNPACDWSLRLPDGSLARLIVAHPPPPLTRPLMATRRLALSSAAETMAKEQGPRILAGDLNCTPFSSYFQLLLDTSGLRDSALGHGLPSTWQPLPPLGLPIDHILVSNHWEITRRIIGPALGSDHRPVLLTLRKIQ